MNCSWRGQFFGLISKGGINDVTSPCQEMKLVRCYQTRLSSKVRLTVFTEKKVEGKNKLFISTIKTNLSPL